MTGFLPPRSIVRTALAGVLTAGALLCGVTPSGAADGTATCGSQLKDWTGPSDTATYQGRYTESGFGYTFTTDLTMIFNKGKLDIHVKIPQATNSKETQTLDFEGTYSAANVDKAKKVLSLKYNGQGGVQTLTMRPESCDATTSRIYNTDVRLFNDDNYHTIRWTQT